MKVLDRYILSEFLKVLAMTVLSILFLFMLIEVMEKLDDLIEKGVPARESLAFFVYKIPFVLGQISPVAVLLAVLISLGTLSRQGEITAVRAGGISMVRAVAPLFVCGVAITAAVIYINESVTPFAMRKVNHIDRLWLKGAKDGVLGNRGLWVRTPAGIYNVLDFDIEKGTMRGVTLYELKRPFGLAGRIHAREAGWKGESWVADEAEIQRFDGNEVVEEKTVKKFVLPGLKAPDEFTNLETSHEKMSFSELRDFILDLEAEGYNTSRYRVDLYGKITFPVVNLIMVLVGVPFALKTGRYGGIAVGVGLSVLIGFSFWIIFAVSRTLGQSGILPPLAAAAFPDVLFFAVGALMFGYVRQ
ncbi:MAG TPA: LPS export ABC transporter permease LptG [Deltaproteobacteria bacterium]|nr:LPS export ABC transporter permease LptG [Deltaproteobacteria bacterium]